MANTRISELPAGVALTGDEVMPIVQGGVTKRVPLSLLGDQTRTPARVGALSALGEQLRRAYKTQGRASILPAMSSPPTMTYTAGSGDATLTNKFYLSRGLLDTTMLLAGGTPSRKNADHWSFGTTTLPATDVGNVWDTNHLPHYGGRNGYGWWVEFECDQAKCAIETLMGPTGGVEIEVWNSTTKLWEFAGMAAHPSTSGYGHLTLDFGSSAVRRIRAGSSSGGAGLRGLATTAGGKIWKPLDYVGTRLRLVSIGDSVAASTGATRPTGSWQWGLARLLGLVDNWQIAIGSSGFINVGNGSTFGDKWRLADLEQAVRAPGAVPVFVQMMSGNDGLNTAAAITAAALSTWRKYRQVLGPDVPMIIGGVWPGNTDPSANNLKVENAGKAAFDAWNDPASLWVPIATDPAGSWITAANGPGFSLDAAHPNQDGHDYLAGKWLNALRTQFAF